MPKTSIIIPIKDNLGYTKQCLESISKHTKDYEVIIVNNASGPETAKYLKSGEAKVNGRVIWNSENKSFSVANNQAAKVADGEFLCLLNNDTVVTEGWLDAMLDTFNDGVGLVGARLAIPGRGTIQHAGVEELPDRRPNHVMFGWDMQHPKVLKEQEVFAVTGACMVVRKDLYLELGGLDENFIYGWEDIDLAQRIKEAGYKIIYQPKSLVFHYESKTPGRYSHENHNYLYYMSKWTS